jgi:hypothetical protein
MATEEIVQQFEDKQGFDIIWGFLAVSPEIILPVVREGGARHVYLSDAAGLWRLSESKSTKDRKGNHAFRFLPYETLVDVTVSMTNDGRDALMGSTVGRQHRAMIGLKVQIQTTGGEEWNILGDALVTDRYEHDERTPRDLCAAFKLCRTIAAHGVPVRVFAGDLECRPWPGVDTAG